MKTVALWGYGREGRAAAAFLAARYPALSRAILNDTPVDGDTDGMPVVTGDQARQALENGRFDLVVKSPGISLYRPEIAVARSNGTRFTSSTNLWMEANPSARIVAVTGTKGKSTTSSLIHFLARQAGLRSALLGNVGAPVIGSEPGADVTVLELSSYQIADLEFAPSIAVFTNLHPEHAPWHEGHANYYRDKMRLAFINQTIPVIANGNETRLMQHLAGRSNLRLFGSEGFVATETGVALDDHPIHVKGLPLPGHHNRVNLAGAFETLRTLGVDIVARDWDMTDFVPLPHRLQEVTLASGVIAVNDSISTIPETTRAPLDAYDGRPIHLLLGGVDRGQDFGPLLDHIRERGNIHTIRCLKGNGSRIAEDARARGLPVAGVHDRFENAVNAMLDIAGPGEIIMLSPGAPSQEEFTDFEARGNRFLDLCRAYRNTD